VGKVMHIVIVNINGLKYTVPLVDGLKHQTYPFKATVYDQNSFESGTKEFLESLQPPFEVVMNDSHVDLNRIWDNHYLNSGDPYLCFLNNDVEVPHNFVEDTVRIFEAEPKVGCVIHSTNHPDFTKPAPFWYEVLSEKVVQGWDFTLRREAYVKIPDELKTFGGDDFLFSNLYQNGWKVAVALSSPIVHHYAKSRHFYTGSRQEEATAYARYGYPKLGRCPFSRRFPIKAEQ
jgi:GT2 family glycosyltransferase